MAALIPQKMFDEQLAAMDIENFAQATIRQVGAVGGALEKNSGTEFLHLEMGVLPQHHGHRPAQERGFALRQGVPRHRRRPRGMHPDRRLDAGRLLPVPDQLAVRPQERHHSVHRPGLPGAAPAGAHPGHQARIVRHLRLPRRETRSQAGELSQAGQRRGDHLLEPQQPGVDLPHRERTAHHRRVVNQVRHDRSRRLGLHGHGLPQGAGTSFPGSVPGHRSPLYG